MASNYAKRMARLSARIFGEVYRPTDSRSMKVVKIFSGLPAHIDPYRVNYYPRHVQLTQLMDGIRFHGLYRDEHEEFKEFMKKRREARGKVKKVPYYVTKRLEREAEAKKAETSAASE